MDTSILIARIVGPVFLVASASLIVSPARIDTLAREFLEHRSLMFVSGVLLMIGGLAIVNTHNRWALDWTFVITLLGWVAVLGGALRILAPDALAEIGRKMLDRPVVTRAGGIAWAAIGLYMTWKGYF